MTESHTSTKEKILRIAVELFSDNGYDRVSMRDIAKSVGIKASSIYNHFRSKEDILESAYDYYERKKNESEPDLDNLLALAEKEPPFELLMKLEYHYDAETQILMNRIIAIASREVSHSPRSVEFIAKNLLNKASDRFSKILERLISLGKIEPLDINAFSCLLKYYSYSAAALDNSPLKIGIESWQAGVGLIYSMIKPVNSESR